MHQIRLFVICNSQVIRQSLSVIFSSQNNFLVVGQGEISEASIVDVQQLQPDAILIKFNPIEGALDTVRRIKEYCPYTKIIMFIENTVIDEKYASLAVEVDGCLHTSMIPRDLVRAVELTCRTGVFCLPSFLKWMIQCPRNTQLGKPEHTHSEQNVLPVNQEAARIKANFHLTAREIEIYRLITQNNSNKEIGEKLLISQPTVKSHVSNILRKLELSNRIQLMFYEIQNRCLSNLGEINNEKTDITGVIQQ